MTAPRSGTPVSSLPNLGPAMEASCARAGIDSAEALQALGADQAYARLLEAGTVPHFIGYYVLQMALQGRPWNDCRGAEKAALRVQFDALVAETRSTTPTGIEAELREIGLIAPQPPSRS